MNMSSKSTAGRAVAAVTVSLALGYGSGAHAQREQAGQPSQLSCSSPGVIPRTGPEPAPRLVVGAPLAQPLASRGVAVIPYCAEHMRLAPVFGPGALTVSPRVGHVHVTVDGSPWHWADASGAPIILRGLPPGAHTVRIDLVDANHTIVDDETVTFDVPAAKSQSRRSNLLDGRRAANRRSR